MLSKREEEKNEKILRGLLKLPPNRNCINCNCLGPQYVCINFWTFVCMTCSGIHREFTHRVKSVSMAKFTTQEIEALQKGGNQRAREVYLKDWDLQEMRLPSNSNVDKIRGFIKDVYVHKKYAGGTSSDRPQDTPNLKNHEEDPRRANSYHSFSQSPPYEHQYEDRRYGKKQTITLTRGPGSDQGLYRVTVSSSVYSPTQLREQVHEESFANGSSGSRYSDYSFSSSQSPGFQDSEHDSPNLHLRDILFEDAPSHLPKSNVKRDFDAVQNPQRTASGSFGSVDANSKLSKPLSPGNTTGAVLVPETPNRTQQEAASKSPSLSQLSTFRHARKQDLASQSPVQTSALSSFTNVNHQSLSAPLEQNRSLVHPSTSSAPSIDLFANFSIQSPSITHNHNSMPEHPSTSIDLFANFSHQSSLTLLEQSLSPAKLSTSSAPSFDLFANAGHQSLPTLFEQQPSHVRLSTSPAPSIDLFANVSHKSSPTPLEKKPSAVMTSVNEGWASFDFPQTVGSASETNKVVSAMVPPGNGEAKGSKDALATVHHNSQWFSEGSSTVVQPFTFTNNPLNINLHEDLRSSNQKISQQWSAKDDFSGTMFHSTFVGLPPNSGLQFPVSMSSSFGFSKDLNNGFRQSSLDNTLPCLRLPSTAVSASSNSLSASPLTAETFYSSKSTNPFDLEANETFLDMSPLNAAIPNSQMSTAFLNGLPQQWFPHNSATQGGIAYVPGQPHSPNVPNLHPQGSVTSFGGNPFA